MIFARKKSCLQSILVVLLVKDFLEQTEQDLWIMGSGKGDEANKFQCYKIK